MMLEAKTVQILLVMLATLLFCVKSLEGASSHKGKDDSHGKHALGTFFDHFFGSVHKEDLHKKGSHKVKSYHKKDGDFSHGSCGHGTCGHFGHGSKLGFEKLIFTGLLASYLKNKGKKQYHHMHKNHVKHQQVIVPVPFHVKNHGMHYHHAVHVHKKHPFPVMHHNHVPPIHHHHMKMPAMYLPPVHQYMPPCHGHHCG